jgi:hypothetical protein
MPLAYVAWRAGTTYKVVGPVRQAGNRFLGSFKGLQIRALLFEEKACCGKDIWFGKIEVKQLN